MELDMTVLEYPSGGSGRNVIIFGIDWVNLQRLMIEKMIF